MQTYPERSRRLVDQARAFERGLNAIPGCNPLTPSEAAERVYWRIPLHLDPPRDAAETAARLQQRHCPVEQGGRTLMPRHSALTEYYGVRTERAFPVAERLAARTLRVHPFPLYPDGAVERLLHEFAEVFRT
jgi:dTDP-4-amino-4,6-dideoxygalactose transaminase